MTNANAVVKYPCKEVSTRYGKKLTVVFQTDDGEQITKWSNLNDTQMINFKRNQRVSLSKEGNKIIVIPLTTVENTIKQQDKKDEEEKNILLTKAQRYVKHYEDCDKMVRESITMYKNEDSLRAITTTVFLQSVREI